MNEKLKVLTKNPKLLIAVGLCGILLVFLSSLFSGGSESQTATEAGEQTTEQYRISLEEGIKEIVSEISGDSDPTVVITLESSIRYSYASADETDTSSSGDTNGESRESKKQSVITVKTADGGERPLVVTEIMPEVRGVAIICSGGNSEAIAEKIENAVTAALNITTKRVYISGGTGDEKR